MKRSCYSILFGVLIIMASCSDKVIAPKYTYVEKVLDLTPGMKFNVVNSTLGCEPYDMYVNQSSGKKTYVWKYKHNERYVSSSLLDKKDGATVGDDRVKDQSTLYCIFSNDHILESISTEAGRADAVKLILFDNTFRVASQDVEKYNSFQLSSEQIEKVDMSEDRSAGTGGIFGSKK